jgi:hypothetical protein
MTWECRSREQGRVQSPGFIPTEINMQTVHDRRKPSCLVQARPGPALSCTLTVRPPFGFIRYILPCMALLRPSRCLSSSLTTASAVQLHQLLD